MVHASSPLRAVERAGVAHGVDCDDDLDRVTGGRARRTFADRRQAAHGMPGEKVRASGLLLIVPVERDILAARFHVVHDGAHFTIDESIVGDARAAGRDDGKDQQYDDPRECDQISQRAASYDPCLSGCRPQQTSS